MSSDTHRIKNSSASRAGVWLWSLVWLAGTAAICWGAAKTFTPRVEDRILSSIQSVLVPMTESTPVIASVHGRDATLTGKALDEQHRASLLSAVENVPGVRSVSDQLNLLNASTKADTDSPDGSAVEADAPDSSEDAKTLTVIDSTSKETSADSADILEDVSPSSEEANADDMSTATENIAEEDSSDAKNEEINADLDSDAEGTAEDLQDSDADSDGDIVVATIDSSDSNNLASPEVQTVALLAPMLDFNIEGKTLAVSGRLSSQDDAAPLIRTAMVEFDIDYISNTIEVSDDVSNASWLASLSEFLPEMGGLENPSIEVIEDEIKLGGNAPDTDIQDAVLGAAVTRLGSYKMSEDIILAPDSSDSASEQASSSDTQAEDVAKSASAADVDANMETDTDASSDDVDTSDTQADSDDSSTVDPDTDSANYADVSESESADSSTNKNDDSDAISEVLDDAKSNIDTEQSNKDEQSLGTAFRELPSMDVLFQSNRDILTTESLDVLDMIAEVLIAHPDIPIRIEGHTDASGAQQDNLILSQLRANAVRDYLVDRGVSIYRLKAYGFGEGVPVSDNGTPEGRADNRRIEFNF